MAVFTIIHKERLGKASVFVHVVVVVVDLRSKVLMLTLLFSLTLTHELKTKIYSHAHSPILTLAHAAIHSFCTQFVLNLYSANTRQSSSITEAIEQGGYAAWLVSDLQDG